MSFDVVVSIKVNCIYKNSGDNKTEKVSIFMEEINADVADTMKRM